MLTRAFKTFSLRRLLFNAGAIPRLGRVDDGSAHLDFEPEEQKRRESLSLAVGTFEHDGTRISLVDTPGYPDFAADMIEGFAAADGALIVMDASAGVAFTAQRVLRAASVSRPLAKFRCPLRTFVAAPRIEIRHRVGDRSLREPARTLAAPIGRPLETRAANRSSTAYFPSTARR